jgi:hypothetical protein
MQELLGFVSHGSDPLEGEQNPGQKHLLGEDQTPCETSLVGQRHFGTKSFGLLGKSAGAASVRLIKSGAVQLAKLASLRKLSWKCYHNNLETNIHRNELQLHQQSYDALGVQLR